MNRITVKSQEELDLAIDKPDTTIIDLEEGIFLLVTSATMIPVLNVASSAKLRVVACDSSQPRVVAYGSSQPIIVAYGSSQPIIVAYGSSQPRVVACDSSQPSVVAHGSSQPRVVAHGSSQPSVMACDSSQPRVVAHGSSQPRVVAHGSSQPRVVAHGSSQPSVVAHDSSQPSVMAYGSSQPSVMAHGSSQPSVVAHDSSQPRVVAHGSSQPRVEAHGSSRICLVATSYGQCSLSGWIDATATENVPVLIHGNKPVVVGGRQTRIEINTPAKWCDYYSVPVKDGIATVYKGVNDNFVSPKGSNYTPGTTPECHDWDEGKEECGGGFHFSPTPIATLQFNSAATRFVACPVALADMRAPHENDKYPNKIKASRVCDAIFEVDLHGSPIAK